jgi:hypothetical protein
VLTRAEARARRMEQVSLDSAPAALWFAQLLSEGVVFFEPDWDTLRRPAPPGDRGREAGRVERTQTPDVSSGCHYCRMAASIGGCSTDQGPEAAHDVVACQETLYTHSKHEAQDSSASSPTSRPCSARTLAARSASDPSPGTASAGCLGHPVLTGCFPDAKPGYRAREPSPVLPKFI